jgi:putative endonuclease
MPKQFATYIVANAKPSLYIGVTSNLIKRVGQHKTHELEGFTDKYNCDKLVYFELLDSAEAALEREKQLKRWRREWKMNLIKEVNPELKDLYSEILGQEDPETSSG